MTQVTSFVPWVSWNITLFQDVHATAASAAWLIFAAVLMAKWLLLPMLALAAWNMWRQRSKISVAYLLGATLVSTGIEAMVSAFAYHPRPFAVGYGPAWLAHAADNSMPSTHVTLALILLAVVLGLRCYRSAAVMALFTVALAWARIYVGVHWPVDMLGAVISAAISLGVVRGALWAMRVLWDTMHGRSPSSQRRDARGDP